MAAVDVAGCVTAVASAFQGGADLVQAIMERRDKKKWRKDKDQESVFQERMLHRALVDAASQCQNTALDRRQRFGQAFDRGDNIAVAELKDVILDLQSTVTNALQKARYEKNAILDLPKIHESVITQKNNALRSIDDLCRRAMRAVPAPAPTARTYSNAYAAPQISHSVYPIEKQEYGWQSAQRSYSADFYNPHQRPIASNFAPASYSGNPGYIDQSLVRSPSIQNTPISMMARNSSSASSSTYNSWYSRHNRQPSDISSMQEKAPAEERQDSLPALDELSLHDSAVSGTVVRSKHHPKVSFDSSVDDAITFFASEAASRDYHRILGKELSPEAGRSCSVISDVSSGCRTASSTPSQFASPDLSAPNGDSDDDDAEACDSAESEARARQAPEVVTKEHESSTSRAPKGTVRMKHPPNLQTIHPAHRQLYTSPESLPQTSPSEAENIWSPLPRPAKINNYHNFCKATWEIRQHSVPLNSSTSWTCPHCAFQLTGTTSPPTQPSTHRGTGIMYTPAFLAKSHLPATPTSPDLELHSYGCIFCAAQGRETDRYANLDALMGHLSSKHRVEMLTPEVLGKTRCVVGRGAEGEEWDVCLPVTVEGRGGMGGLLGKVGLGRKMRGGGRAGS